MKFKFYVINNDDRYTLVDSESFDKEPTNVVFKCNNIDKAMRIIKTHNK